MFEKVSRSPQADAGAAPDGTRRALVGIAACTPVLAAAVALIRRQPPVVAASPSPQVAAPVADGVGYHETDHIRRYYRSAKYF